MFLAQKASFWWISGRNGAAPCKQIGPSLEEISDEMGDAITVAKVNIDENPMTPSKYGVRGIPTLMLFKNGEVAATKVGALPKGKLVEWIQSSV